MSCGSIRHTCVHILDRLLWLLGSACENQRCLALLWLGLNSRSIQHQLSMLRDGLEIHCTREGHRSDRIGVLILRSWALCVDDLVDELEIAFLALMIDCHIPKGADELLVCVRLKLEPSVFSYG